MRAEVEGNPPMVKPGGEPGSSFRRCGATQGELMLEKFLPARGGHHVKSARGSQMRLRTRPPLFFYLLRLVFRKSHAFIQNSCKQHLKAVSGMQAQHA